MKSRQSHNFWCVSQKKLRVRPQRSIRYGLNISGLLCSFVGHKNFGVFGTAQNVCKEMLLLTRLADWKSRVFTVRQNFAKRTKIETTYHGRLTLTTWNFHNRTIAGVCAQECVLRMPAFIMPQSNLLAMAMVCMDGCWNMPCHRYFMEKEKVLNFNLGVFLSGSGERMSVSRVRA